MLKVVDYNIPISFICVNDTMLNITSEVVTLLKQHNLIYYSKIFSLSMSYDGD